MDRNIHIHIKILFDTIFFLYSIATLEFQRPHIGMPQQQLNNNRTYQAGDDEEQRTDSGLIHRLLLRRPTTAAGGGNGSNNDGSNNRGKSSWLNILFNDDTLTAARMHSIGHLGADERVAADGTLTIARRKKISEMKKKKSYGQLTDLFQKPPTRKSIEQKQQEDQQQQLVDAETDEEEEGIEIETTIEGGSLGAAAFG